MIPTTHKLLRTLLLIIFLCQLIFGQSDYENGKKSYERGEFEQAIKFLKTASKIEKRNPLIWNHLGLTYLKMGEMRKAEKVFGKASKLNPGNLKYKFNLAYVNMLRGGYKKAGKLFSELIELDPKNAEFYYLRGLTFLKRYKFEKAKADADSGISIQKTFVPSYLLKAHSMLYEFGTLFPKDNDDREATRNFIETNLSMVEESISILRTCQSVCGDVSNSKLQETTEAFEGYYKLSKQIAAGLDISKIPDGPNERKLKITSKPRPGYTDEARSRGIQGSVRLMVTFSSWGKIADVFVVKSLGGGLDEIVLKAVKKIQFEPAIKNGKAVSSLRVLQYHFTIY